jgi:hypothetical protein
MALAQSHEQTDQEHYQCHQTSEVERALHRLLDLGNHHEDQAQTQYPWHHVHKEDHAPVQVLGDVAAEHWSQGRTEGHAHAVESHGQTTLMGRECTHQKHHGHRGNGAPSQSLEHTENDERGTVPGQTTQP